MIGGHLPNYTAFRSNSNIHSKNHENLRTRYICLLTALLMRRANLVSRTSYEKCSV